MSEMSASTGTVDQGALRPHRDASCAGGVVAVRAPFISFFLTCVPPTTTHQAKRIVKMGKFSRLADRPELVEARHTLEQLLLPHQPSSPVTGPVVLMLQFTWPWRASESKKVRARGRIPHTSRPDASNLAKTIEDRLAALRFIEDDNAVVSLHVAKWWGDTPGIHVVIDPFTYTQGQASFIEQVTFNHEIEAAHAASEA